MLLKELSIALKNNIVTLGNRNQYFGRNWIYLQNFGITFGY